MPATAFEYFVGRRNFACVRLLEQNEDVSSLFQALLEHMVDYANKEGIEFRDIRIDRPFISNDGVLQARILRG